MLTTCYRYANYPTPLRRIPSQNQGRYHRPDALLPTQYFADHPLGAWAEFARWNPAAMRQPADVEVRIWGVLIDVEQLVQIDFGNASSFGIQPERLVADDYSDCQDLADRLHDDSVTGFVVPSAALPGTRSIVLFGQYVLARYDALDVDDDQVRGSLLAEDARPPREIETLFRPKGAAHPALRAWERGVPYEFPQPLLFADAGPH